MKKYLAFFIIAICILLSASAFAQTAGSSCAGEADGSSVVVKSGTTHTRLVCNGSVYSELDRWDSSGWTAVKMGAPASFSPSSGCNTQNEGQLVYDKTRNALFVCNGSGWRVVGISIYIGLQQPCVILRSICDEGSSFVQLRQILR